MLNTKIDLAVDLIREKKKISLLSLSKTIKWEMNALERVLLILENAGLIELHYPSTMIQQPYATLSKSAIVSNQNTAG